MKTLEWRTIGSLQQAETSIGWYTVIREPNAEEFPWLVSLRGQGLQSFMREADAKDFAQRHFTECIQGGVTDNALSSLASSERSGREAVFEECAKVADAQAAEDEAHFRAAGRDEDAKSHYLWAMQTGQSIAAAIRKLSEVSHEH